MQTVTFELFLFCGNLKSGDFFLKKIKDLKKNSGDVESSVSAKSSKLTAFSPGRALELPEEI